MRTTFGVRDVSLDLGAALEEGHIILVNLATEGAKISDDNAKLFSSLLISDLWTAAKERGKPGDGRQVKPFYVYIDEFQDVVTPTIARNLDQARGFGLHLTLTNQFPRQILNSGPQGQQVYDSVMENASSKVVFRLSEEENLLPLAKWLFRGVFNPDEIKHQLYSTKVMAYREETREVYSESSGTSSTQGGQTGKASGSGIGGTLSHLNDETGAPIVGASESNSDFGSESESTSESYATASGESVSKVPVFIPVFGKELSSVQFRSLEEQFHRAMAVLFDQKERHSVVRLAGEKVPVAIRTPDVTPLPASLAMRQRYLASRYAQWNFALTGEDARARVAALDAGLSNELIAKSTTEPATAKRRIR